MSYFVLFWVAFLLLILYLHDYLTCCIRRTVCAHQAAVSFFLYLHFLTNKFINSLSPLNFSKREVRKTSSFIRLIHSTNSITAVIDSFVHSFTHAMTSSIYRNLIGCSFSYARVRSQHVWSRAWLDPVARIAEGSWLMLTTWILCRLMLLRQCTVDVLCWMMLIFS